MDLATATEIVRADMQACHPEVPLCNYDWSDDEVLYDFILGTTSPDTTYESYRLHDGLAEAYQIVHAHVYRHMAAELEATGDPHTLCGTPRCSLGEGHQLPCTEDASGPTEAEYDRRTKVDSETRITDEASARAYMADVAKRK